MLSEVVNEEVRVSKPKKTHRSSKDLLVEVRMIKLEVVIVEVQGLAKDASNGIVELRK